MEVQKTRTSEARPEPRKHTKDPTLAPLFGTATFFEIFWIAQRVPLHFFRYFAAQWLSKNPKGSPFYIYRQ